MPNLKFLSSMETKKYSNVMVTKPPERNRLECLCMMFAAVIYSGLLLADFQAFFWMPWYHFEDSHCSSLSLWKRCSSDDKHATRDGSSITWSIIYFLLSLDCLVVLLMVPYLCMAVGSHRCHLIANIAVLGAGTVGLLAVFIFKVAEVYATFGDGRSGHLGDGFYMATCLSFIQMGVSALAIVTARHSQKTESRKKLQDPFSVGDADSRVLDLVGGNTNQDTRLELETAFHYDPEDPGKRPTLDKKYGREEQIDPSASRNLTAKKLWDIFYGEV